jgi:putative addiction module CopG family antidote
MTLKNIELNQEQEAWIESQVQSGNFSSASDFINSLVENAMKQHAEQSLKKLIEEAENSGFSSQSPEQIWKRATSTLCK